MDSDVATLLKESAAETLADEETDITSSNQSEDASENNVSDILKQSVAEVTRPKSTKTSASVASILQESAQEVLKNSCDENVLSSGVEVEARFGGKDTWYEGKIVKKNSDGTYEIKYSDGDCEKSVSKELIRTKSEGGSSDASPSSNLKPVKELGSDGTNNLKPTDIAGALKSAAEEVELEAAQDAVTGVAGGSELEQAVSVLETSAKAKEAQEKKAKAKDRLSALRKQKQEDLKSRSGSDIRDTETDDSHGQDLDALPVSEPAEPAEPEDPEEPVEHSGPVNGVGGLDLDLLEACKSDDYKSVRDLAGGGGVDVEAVDRHGWTALHWAAATNSLRAVQELTSVGVDLNHPDETCGWTPLHLATINGHADVVAHLVSAGARAAATDATGTAVASCIPNRRTRPDQAKAIARSLGCGQPHHLSALGIGTRGLPAKLEARARASARA
jgi:hypothetical protein